MKAKRKSSLTPRETVDDFDLDDVIEEDEMLDEE
jgi:hypothetical protein